MIRFFLVAFSYKCNFICRHCSIGAGPHHNEVLPVEYVEKALREASDIASIQLVVATGGEPTLFPRHLELLIKTAADFGLSY